MLNYLQLFSLICLAQFRNKREKPHIFAFREREGERSFHLLKQKDNL